LAQPVQTMLDVALACHREGRLEEAETLYRRVLEGEPENADCLHLLGMAVFQSGDAETAAAMIRRAVALNPRAASYHSNLGNVLYHQGYARDAAASFLQALRINPALPEVCVNLGNVFQAAREFGSAAEWYEQAIAMNPAIPEAHKHLGDALLNLERLELARGAYERALALRPEYVDAMTELGTVLRASGDLEGARRSLRRAREMEPEHATAGFREALVCLLLGEFAAGWELYEERWGSPDHATPMRAYPQPFWQGEGLGSGGLLLWREQGVGDEIMFAGMMPEVVKTGSRCVLECDARLQPLFARSFPGVEVTSEPDVALNPAWEIGAQLPTGSLPRLFRKERSAFASGGFAYLKADPAKTAECRRRYGEGLLRVGVAWRSTNAKTGRSRSIALETLRPLFGQPGTRWISLQYGDLDELQEEVGVAEVPVAVDPCVDQLASLDDFAAQIAALDLVITIDNTTAHLAGALGVPVWVLLPFAPDWRWMAEGGSSLWYASMRLFRQPKRGDWEDVVRETAGALAGVVAAR